MAAALAAVALAAGVVAGTGAQGVGAGVRAGDAWRAVHAGHARAVAPPAGASARCRDGSFSFSAHRSGTCSHHGGVVQWLGALAGGSGATANVSAAAGSGAGGPGGASVGAVPGTVLLAPRTRTAGCVQGILPDRRCSPGALDPSLTRDVLCSATFRTGSVRAVTTSMKHAVEVEYGMAPRSYGRTIEIDHIVSLELGGSNDIANLYPEPGSGTANYHVKDALENRLHRLVCAGTITLNSAQRDIASDWTKLYVRVFDVHP